MPCTVASHYSGVSLGNYSCGNEHVCWQYKKTLHDTIVFPMQALRGTDFFLVRLSKSALGVETVTPPGESRPPSAVSGE